MSIKIVGNSKIIKNTIDEAFQIAKTHFSVFLSGESGVGKGVFARFIQENSPRRDKPFIIVSCADLPESMLEDMLFGHEKGAFTSAIGRQIGKFELADKGTLFLDEIGDLSLTAQAKLLRVLQDKELERLGGNQTIKVDVRVISATNKDIQKMMEEGKFRKDLFFRLNSIQLNIPPLRNHLEDVPDLAEHILIRRNGSHKYFHQNTLRRLKQHLYSENNVRELEGIIENAIILAGDAPCVRHEHLKFPPGRFQDRLELAIDKNDLNLGRHITPLLNLIIQQALIKHQWIKTAAAKELCVSGFLLDKLLRNLNISSQASSQYLFNFKKVDNVAEKNTPSQNSRQEQLLLDGFDTRSEAIVEIARRHGYVTNIMVKDKFKTSRSTAQRMLSLLVKSGIFRIEGIGRGARYFFRQSS